MPPTPTVEHSAVDDLRTLLDAIAAGGTVEPFDWRAAVLAVTDLRPGLDRELERAYVGDGDLAAAGTPDASPQLREKLLAILDEWAQPPADMLAKLPKPMSRDAPKGRCTEANNQRGDGHGCGGWHGLPAIHIDYMGHADVTEALLKVDPLWNWRPAALNHVTGGPMIAPSQGKAGVLTMWAYLTIHGVERLCVGTAQASKEDVEKELIGDMIRNGALRFGFAVRLWSKADHEERTVTDEDPAAQPARQERTATARAQVAEQSAAAAQTAGGSPEAETAGQAAAAEEGTAANRLAGVATSGPLKTRAVKRGRELAPDYSREPPRSFDDLLSYPDPMLEEIIETVAGTSA